MPTPTTTETTTLEATAKAIQVALRQYGINPSAKQIDTHFDLEVKDGSIICQLGIPEDRTEWQAKAGSYKAVLTLWRLPEEAEAEGRVIEGSIEGSKLVVFD